MPLEEWLARQSWRRLHELVLQRDREPGELHRARDFLQAEDERDHRRVAGNLEADKRVPPVIRPHRDIGLRPLLAAGVFDMRHEFDAIPHERLYGNLVGENIGVHQDGTSMDGFNRQRERADRRFLSGVVSDLPHAAMPGDVGELPRSVEEPVEVFVHDLLPAHGASDEAEHDETNQKPIKGHPRFYHRPSVSQLSSLNFQPAHPAAARDPHPSFPSRRSSRRAHRPSPATRAHRRAGRAAPRSTRG